MSLNLLKADIKCEPIYISERENLFKNKTMDGLLIPVKGKDELEGSVRETVTVQSFFEIGIKAKCLITDCKTELKTKTPSHLLRHIEQMHPSKLSSIDEKSINSLSLPVLRQSTLNLLVQHVTISGRPFLSIKDASFRELMSERMIRLRARGPHKLSVNLNTLRAQVLKMAELVKEKIKKNVEGRKVSLMMDVASKHHRSIFGVSLQYIDKDEIKTQTIMMEKILKRHTAKNLTEMLKKALNEYAIPLQDVFSLTSDNGSNMIATTAELDELALEMADEWFDSEMQASLLSVIDQEDRSEMLEEIAKEMYNNEGIVPFNYNCITAVRCGSHTFQRAVEAAWAQGKCTETEAHLSTVISTARSVVKELRNGIWITYLEEEAVPIPSLDNITRWFSIYIMLLSLLKCKQFLMNKAEEIRILEENGSKIDKTKKMKHVLTEYEWKVVEEVVDIMHPAYELMKKMQSTAFTLSDFFVTWSLIKISMKQYENKPNLLTDLTKQMVANMLKYEPRLFLNPLLICSIYLDPRVASVLARTDDHGLQRKVVAKSELVKIYKRLKKENHEPTVSTNNSHFSRFTDLESAFDAFLDSHECNSSSNDQNSNEGASSVEDILALELECIEFEKEKRLPLKSNILEFWEQKKKQYPLLYPITQVIMAVPSSQTTVERCFSAFGIIYSNSRTLMSSEVLQAVLLIRTNPTVFEEVADELLVKAAGH